MTERIAIYPGSFDPPTNGHLDLIQRACRIFDKVIVAVAYNNEKESLFSVQERVQMLEAITKDLPMASVSSFGGLTAEFARQQGAVALIRGLRAVSDFEFELMMALTNQSLNPEVDTVCMMPSEPYLFTSSRIIKQIARLGGDISKVAPPEVIKKLQEKFGISNPEIKQ